MLLLGVEACKLNFIGREAEKAYGPSPTALCSLRFAQKESLPAFVGRLNRERGNSHNGKTGADSR
jgi:hypothetical protein